MSISQKKGIALPEGAFRPTRIEFVPEEFYGYTPADPAWKPISDGIRTFNPGYGHELSEDAYLGNADYSRQVQSESSEPELTSAFQQWLYDTNGNRQALSSWAFDRVANLMPPSLTLIRRQEAGSPTNTTHPGSSVDARYNPNTAEDGSGSTGKHIRVYDVLKGLEINEAALVAENGESTVNEEITGMAQRGRMYQIDQPASDTELVAFVTEPNGPGDGSGSNTTDTNLQVVIEGGDAPSPTSETIAIDGTDATTPVASSTVFGPGTDGIDAIEVQDSNGVTVDGDNSDMLGNLVVAIADDTTVSPPTYGEWLCVLFGKSDQGGARPNEGVPPLGSGTHAGSISGSNAPEFYQPESIGVQRPVGSNIAVASGVIQTMELAVENNIETVQGSGRQMMTFEGMRGLEFTVSLSGETVTPYLQTIALTEANETSRILFDVAGNEYVDLERAELEETDAEDEGGEPVTEREATFLPQRAADGSSAITISNAS